MSFIYPHKLYKVVKGELNDYGQSEDIKVFVCDCDEQPNSKGSIISKNDGTTYQFTSNIFLPIVSGLMVGDSIEVLDGEEVRLKGVVARNSNKDCVGSRIWV